MSKGHKNSQNTVNIINGNEFLGFIQQIETNNGQTDVRKTFQGSSTQISLNTKTFCLGSARSVGLASPRRFLGSRASDLRNSTADFLHHWEFCLLNRSCSRHVNPAERLQYRTWMKPNFQSKEREEILVTNWKTVAPPSYTPYNCPGAERRSGEQPVHTCRAASKQLSGCWRLSFAEWWMEWSNPKKQKEVTLECCCATLTVRQTTAAAVSGNFLCLKPQT